MLELRDYALANVLRLLLVLRLVSRHCSQNRYPAPFCALAEGDEEAGEGLGVEREDTLVVYGLLNLSESDNGVGNDLG
jgi:hypothetical protein